MLVFPGQSTITFIYDFVESFSGPHPGYAVLSGRPQAGTALTAALSLKSEYFLFSFFPSNLYTCPVSLENQASPPA